jgi:hypothetical protein
MGRYWNTETEREGKFCFALQSSTSPERFGMVERMDHIVYYGDMSNFNINYLNECLIDLGYKDADNYSVDELEKILEECYDSKENVKNKPKTLCDLELGLNIYLDILKEDWCSLTAEL